MPLCHKRNPLETLQKDVKVSEISRLAIDDKFLHLFVIASPDGTNWVQKIPPSSCPMERIRHTHTKVNNMVYIFNTNTILHA